MADLAIPETDALMSFGGGNGRLASSLDLKTQEGRVKLLRCMNDCDKRLTECINEGIMVTNYVIHEIEIESRNGGELITVPRLVLISKDGKTYECVSETLLQSLKVIAFAYGRMPWEPARKLTVRTKKKGERSIYWFETEDKK